MSDSFDLFFHIPLFSQFEPDDAPVKFQRKDAQHLAAFFPFDNNLPDEERKKQAESWFNRHRQYSLITAVMWLDSSGKVQLLDQDFTPLPIEECVFNVKTIRTEVMLKDSIALETYRNGVKAYWEKVIHLNTNVHILEKLNGFPWAVFTTRDKRIFFAQTFENFMNDSVVLANSILGDEQNNKTIINFMGVIRKDLVREDFVNSFQQHQKETKARVNLANLKKRGGLLDRLNLWRSNVIAHFKEWRLSQNGPPPDVTRITFRELLLIVETINTLFHALSFNEEYLAYKMEYNPSVIHNHPYHTDIEDILDSLAKDSDRLNMSEKYPEQWVYLRQVLEQDEIEIINKYRVKFGLPPA